MGRDSNETRTWRNIFSMKLNHFEFDVRIYSLTRLYEQETFFIWTFITKGVVTKGDWDTFMTLQLLSQSRSSIADTFVIRFYNVVRTKTYWIVYEGYFFIRFDKLVHPLMHSLQFL